MLFNSYIFILLFLPLAVCGYFAFNYTKKYKAANVFLILMSLWFYGYFNPWYLLLICGSIFVNYFVARLMISRENNFQQKKVSLVIGILLNIGTIFYFKYFDFFISNINILFRQSFKLLNITLPLGISFFTFQQISYLVDSYHGETKDYGLLEYILFITFFPQLIAGPIVLHNEMISQFRDEKKRKVVSENLGKGIYVFAVGLFKKVLIADTFGKAVAWGFGTVETLTSIEALIVSFCYTFQLYFDFSGYCDMAVGIGNMFNIQLPANFNSPYKALSIDDFWNRWHISLTRFLTQYVYIPLGGNKKGKVRTYINLMIVFLVSGLWHGANWTFILWGGIHGIAKCFFRLGKKSWNKLGVVTQWLLTFLFVNFTWIIFRAENIGQAGEYIKRIISLNTFTISEELTKCFILPELAWIQNRIKGWRYICSNVWEIYMWLFLAGAFFVVLNFRNSSECVFQPTIKRGILTTILLVYSIISFSGVSIFLYFNF